MPIHCPECTSQRTWKDGIRKTAFGDVQRWLCRDCGFRFSLSPLKENSRWQISRSSSLGSKCRICVSPERKAKNLAKVEPLREGPAGATRLDTKGRIIEFMWKLKREGYAGTTISNYGHILKHLMKKGVNINDPETVKDVIAMQDGWSNGRKNNVVKAYTAFLKRQGLTWEKPRYRPTYKLPFIPTEKEINDLIAGCSNQVSAFLQLLKETAMRRGEAFQLEWTDIDSVTNTVRITPEKGSNPRIFKISNKLATMLGHLHKKSNKVFNYRHANTISRSFVRQRKRIAHKLGNPRLHQIHFHTLRHWKATMEYHKTKDILYVMQLLGHRKIENTLKYTQLVHFQDDEYVSKVATKTEEARQLLEAGFEYVCTTPEHICSLGKENKWHTIKCP